MKIYITRHGETEWNTQGRMQGWKNSDLTEKGITSATKLGESLKHIDFDCIYCSPSGRTIQTAEYIRGEKDTEIILREDLKEMGFGSWEGMEHTKVKELHGVEQDNFWNNPHLYKTVDGESFEELFDRVKRILDEIIINPKGENILIVTHAVTIKAIYAIVKKLSLQELWNDPFIHGTCLSILNVEDDKIEFILEGDISHLN